MLVTDIPWDQRLARLAIGPLRRARISPNHITLLSLAVGLLAALLYARGGGAVHLAGLLFMLACWLDHVDGELARRNGSTSVFGHYLDLFAGGLVLVALFFGMGYGLRSGPLGNHAPVLGAVAGLAVGLIVLMRLEIERRLGKRANRQPAFAGFEIEDLMYLVGPITWLGALAPFLVAAAIGAPIFALFVAWRWWRRFGRTVLS